MADETQIRKLIDDWATAIRAGDMDGVLANHADDILMFDVPEPLYSRGMEAYRQTWELFFRYSRGGPGAFDLSDIEVMVGGNVAFATAIPTIAGAGPLRLTLGLRKEGGRWLIAHEHHSYAAKLEEGGEGQ